MPVSGRPGGGDRTGGSRGHREEPVVTEWVLAEISDVSPASAGFGEHVRLLHREWSNQQRHWSSFPAGLLPPMLNPSSGQPLAIPNNNSSPLRFHSLRSLHRPLSPRAPDVEISSRNPRLPCPFMVHRPETEQAPGSGSDADFLMAEADGDEDYKAPQSCSLLNAGREFCGIQRCTKDLRSRSSNLGAGDWKVSVQIQCYAPEAGYICGIMEANVSPDSPVVTFWEGEIVDNVNHTFITSKWLANQTTDMDSWSKFPPFGQLKQKVLQSKGQCGILREYPYVFMRWKEKFFVSQQENSQLTIQGFYYVCMSRQDGHIWGYYYDPESQPHQELELQAYSQGHHGFGFSDYALR